MKKMIQELETDELQKVHGGALDPFSWFLIGCGVCFVGGIAWGYFTY